MKSRIKVNPKSELFTILLFITLLIPMNIISQNSFDIVVLGSGGGVDDSNLSSYLLSTSGSDRYICLDAGTLMHGLIAASNNGHFNSVKKSNTDEEMPAYILHHHIDAYAISHPHLDHIMGMMIAAPFDNHKSILCSHHTADVLMQHVFESDLWGNFTSEGKNPVGKWDIIRMGNEEWHTIPNNSLKIKSYTLSHSSPNLANAFLVEGNGDYILYFGDTGADEIEGEEKLSYIFKDVAHLIKQQKLKALFIELSFPNIQDNKQLYGHLKPSLLQDELEKLALIVNPKNPSLSLKGLKIFITHMKPDFRKSHNSREIIIQETEKLNKFGAEFIYPKQAEKYKF